MGAPVDYTGARTSEALMEFLRAKAGMPLEVPPSAAPEAAAVAAAPTPDAAHHMGGAQEPHAAAAAAAPGAPEDALMRLQKAVQKVNAIAANAEDMAKQTLQDADAVKGGRKDVGADMPKVLQEAQEVVKTASMPLSLLGLSCVPIRKSSRSQPASLQAPPGVRSQFL